MKKILFPALFALTAFALASFSRVSAPLPAACAADAPAKTADFHAKARAAIGATDLTQLKGSATDTLAGISGKKYLFVYFSAHWCGPCKVFTPKLVEWYNTNKKNGDFEVLFLSADRSEQARVAYMR